MKKLFLSLVAVIVAATTMDAQDVYVATLNHDETITEYYGSTAFQSAYYAAVDGDIITLGGALFLLSGKEVLALVGGSFDKYMEFNALYSVLYSGIKYTIDNGYDRFNFYGITGDFSPKNKLLGLYIS